MELKIYWVLVHLHVCGWDQAWLSVCPWMLPTWHVNQHRFKWAMERRRDKVHAEGNSKVFYSKTKSAVACRSNKEYSRVILENWLQQRYLAGFYLRPEPRFSYRVAPVPLVHAASFTARKKLASCTFRNKSGILESYWKPWFVCIIYF